MPQAGRGAAGGQDFSPKLGERGCVQIWAYLTRPDLGASDFPPNLGKRLFPGLGKKVFRNSKHLHCRNSNAGICVSLTEMQIIRRNSYDVRFRRNTSRPCQFGRPFRCRNIRHSNMVLAHIMGISHFALGRLFIHQRRLDPCLRQLGERKPDTVSLSENPTPCRFSILQPLQVSNPKSFRFSNPSR